MAGPQLDALTAQADRNNQLIIPLVIGGYGLLGSVVSGLISACAIVALLYLLLGKLPVLNNFATRTIAITFIAYILTGLAAAIYHWDDQGNWEFAAMRLVFLGFVPLASVLALTRPEKIRHSLELGAAAGALLTALYVIYEISFVNSRAWGGAGNPGPFSIIMAVTYLINVLALTRSRPSKIVLIHLAAAFGSAFCMMATGMRMAVLFLVIPPVLALVSAISHKGYRLKPLHIGLAMLALIVLLMLPMSGGIAQRFAGLANEFQNSQAGDIANNSMGQRIAMWNYALKVIPDNLLFGIGQDAAKTGLYEFTAQTYGYGLGKTHLHNYVLTGFVRGGIWDVIATTALFIVPLLVFWHYRSSPGGHYALLLGVGSISIFLISALINIGFGHDIMDHLIVFMMAVTTAMGTSLSQPTNQA